VAGPIQPSLRAAAEVEAAHRHIFVPLAWRGEESSGLASTEYCIAESQRLCRAVIGR